MANDKIDLKNLAAGTGKAAADLFGKAKKAVVSSIDQNDDGEFGREDLSLISERWKEKKESAKDEQDRKTLCPFFEEDLDKPEFVLSKMIRVSEMDKKHAESKVCEGSIGYESFNKDLRVLNIYPEYAALFGLKFYPDMDSDVYYVDPIDRDFYIALDDYFHYLKIARVSELQKIAQDLGAKHFRVTYKEHKKTVSANAIKANLNVRIPARGSLNADGSHEQRENSFSKVEIAAEMEFLGHAPVEPELLYFKKDPQIQSLISLRMADNGMTHQIYTLECSNSSGIKVKDAVKIDAALAAMKINGNTSVTSEAESEARRFFEYEIDF